MVLQLAVLGSIFGLVVYEVIKSMASKDKAFGAPGGGYPIVTTDPGVDTTHQIGQLPCPANPPPPAGFSAWSGPVSSALTNWATHVLNTYPMGTFIQDLVGGQLVAARVEWHTWVGATGQTGVCIKGVTLFQPLPS